MTKASRQRTRDLRRQKAKGIGEQIAASPIITAAPWWRRLRAIIRTGEAAVVLAFWTAGITAPDFLIVAILFIAGCAVGVVAALTEPEIKPGQKIIASALVVITFMASGALVYLRHQDSVPPSLFQTQLDQLKEIEAFIGVKDENALRETFDIPNIIRYNILMAKRTFAPQLVDSAMSSEIDAYFKGGNAQISVKFANVSKTAAGAVHVDWLPGKIGLINLSAIYSENTRKLHQYTISSTVPIDVRHSLDDLEKQSFATRN